MRNSLKWSGLVVLVALTLSVLLAAQQQTTPTPPPQQPSEIQLVISGEPGTPPRYAVCVVLAVNRLDVLTVGLQDDFLISHQPVGHRQQGLGLGHGGEQRERPCSFTSCFQ